jgi:NAD(P)H-dependent FMN reductase
MNILAIIGSPKGKGSGFAIVKRIEEEMQQSGPVNFDYLFLKDADLKMCRGCFLCVTRGKELCPLKDDMAEIERRIEEADGIILSSPGYVYSVSGLVKNFMDRFAWTNHRPAFFRQKLMLLANAGAGMHKTLETMRNCFGAGLEIAAELSFMTPPWPLSEKVNRKQERILKKKVQAFLQALEKPAYGEPSLGNYIRFRFFREIAESVKEYLPADWEYYRDKEQYFYPVRVGAGKRLAARLSVATGLALMKDMAPAERI